jgi:hypothetical protein
MFTLGTMKLRTCILLLVMLSIPNQTRASGTSARLPADRWPSDLVRQEQKNCKARLKSITLEYKALTAFGGPNGCGAAAPLEVSSIAGIILSPPIITNCDMAEALYGWIGTSLAEGASADLGKQLVRVNTASDYACRRRNSLSTGKLSEHGRANALDIASLQFSDGSEMSIKGDWSRVGAILGLSRKPIFLKRIRRDACIRFTTVLGPGTDKYHGDHFHVDLAQRRNGYRICK